MKFLINVQDDTAIAKLVAKTKENTERYEMQGELHIAALRKIKKESDQTAVKFWDEMTALLKDRNLLPADYEEGHDNIQLSEDRTQIFFEKHDCSKHNSIGDLLKGLLR
jgi:hypothetical protein